MDFPTIHTNVWDAVIAVPSVLVLTQILKMLLKPPKPLVSFIALVIGVLISVYISHRGQLVAGLLMGWFYGY
ncbi:hypothetical protein [Domibacillus enclensis]|uniref:Uncharacterized protein n=1 Tax=Domibacillus enclensis TaxID=1017273 RepID=A0A1N6NAL0_9BACI|nr:hypothetical protein SAMN05443094_10180 [Domibacillus enclensis]